MRLIFLNFGMANNGAFGGRLRVIWKRFYISGWRWTPLVLVRFKWVPGRKYNEAIAVIEFLWMLLDDIDTYDDLARNNDTMFRNLVRSKQKQRWDTGITSDGYGLDMSGMKVPDFTEDPELPEPPDSDE